MKNSRTTKQRRSWDVTIVDVLVGLAILMILTALIVPIFVPPNGRAATRLKGHSYAVKIVAG